MSKLVRRGGVWYCWIPRPGGGVRRVSTGCVDKKAAADRFKQLERDAVAPSHAAANAATIERILVDYIASRRRLGRAAGTIHHVETKAGHLGRLLPTRVAELEREGHPRMVAYVEARLAEGARRTTVKKELRVFGAAWKLARRNKLATLGLDELMPELEDDYEPRTRALTPWELVALVVALPVHRAAHVVWIVATSARWSESVAARANDRLGHMQVVHGKKTRLSKRIVPLVGAALSMVEWAERTRNVDPSTDERMFYPWTNVRRDLAEVCLKLGIAPVSPNDLRRTFGTWLRNAGVEPALIGAAMGHVDSRMVERVYGRLTPDALGKLLAERVGGGDAVREVADKPLAGHESLEHEESGEIDVESARTENPRVGGSIPSLSTDNPQGNVESEGDSEPPSGREKTRAPAISRPARITLYPGVTQALYERALAFVEPWMLAEGA